MCQRGRFRDRVAYGADVADMVLLGLHCQGQVLELGDWAALMSVLFYTMISKHAWSEAFMSGNM